MARIKIPGNPDRLINLSQSILNKHKADGAASVLSPLNMTDMVAKTDAANSQNQLSAKLYRDAETATQNRDIALGANSTTPGTVNAYVCSVRDVLLGLCKGNEQKLGDWGFEVEQSVASGKTTPAPQVK